MDKDWFTRFEQDHIDLIYLNNMLKATTYFIDWFNDNSIPYYDMLIKMHSMAIDGYRGCSGGCHDGPVSNEFRNFSTGNFLLKKEWFDNIDDRSIRRPKVKNISGEASHWIKNLDSGYELHLSHPKYVPDYIHLLDELMCGIRQEFNLKLLANYIQLFVVIHPFNKVNFSVCMAQVNALLDTHGYNIIYHEYLDFKCFMYDYDIIEKLFVDMVT